MNNIHDFKVCRSEGKIFIKREGDTKIYLDVVSFVRDFPEFTVETDAVFQLSRELLKARERYDRQREKTGNERAVN